MDAILILGGGLKDDGTVNEWTQRRLDKATELYMQKRSLILCLSRGTPYKPSPLDSKGFAIDESFAQASYLLHKGIPADDIRIEPVSLDTVGNAYFSRVLFVDALNITNLTIITSDFHMERSKLAFKWVYSLAPQNNYIFNFVAVSDSGIDAEMLASRSIKEQEGIERLKNNMKIITTYLQLHEWIYTKHTAYAAKKDADKISEEVKKSY